MESPINLKKDAQERHSVLRRLIREGEASTQDELCHALKNKKFDVTQSTVSRDLRRIGAVKMTNSEGEIIYRLPDEQTAVMPRISQGLSGLIREIQSNENIIVIHTTPGSASLVARHLDGLKTSIGVLGTIAGDDAIFVVPGSIKKINNVIEKIKEEF